jgi:hypothetical protein
MEDLPSSRRVDTACSTAVPTPVQVDETRRGGRQSSSPVAPVAPVDLVNNTLHSFRCAPLMGRLNYTSCDNCVEHPWKFAAFFRGGAGVQRDWMTRCRCLGNPPRIYSAGFCTKNRSAYMQGERGPLGPDRGATGLLFVVLS